MRDSCLVSPNAMFGFQGLRPGFPPAYTEKKSIRMICPEMMRRNIASG